MVCCISGVTPRAVMVSTVIIPKRAGGRRTAVACGTDVK